MKNKIVTVYGVLDGISTQKDRTLKLVFRTNELPPDEAGILHGLTHQEGYCAFAPNAIQEIKIPEGKPEFREEKSPSQRLRNVIYVYWQQQGEPGDFESFRKQKMEQVIEFIKSKLE